MPDAAALRQIKSRYRALGPLMDERMRRQWAASEAQTYGRGGVSAVSSATGMSRNTIRKGFIELAARKKHPRALVSTRIRKEGGGRKRLSESDPALGQALDRMIEPSTRGDPMSPLRWTCKSTMNLAQALTRQGHPIGAWTVGAMLKQGGYSLQSNRKTKEGGSPPERNAQFEYINASVDRFQRRGEPVISVDTKKKELVGPFKNGGREWQPKGEPEEVVIHDFVDEELGKVIPYGVFDLSRNEGWVSVGIDHDTAQFAVRAIARWWQKRGAKRYPRARELLLTADGGGSNGSRCRLWKVALQDLATRLGFPVHVRHFPPGTSKWNKIEHRMFSHITENRRARPLVSHEETRPIDRFAAAGNFASYARCVDSQRMSNGKKKGEGNTKNGNKYLAWAFVEAANFALRYCAEAKRFYERKKAKANRALAIKALAHKLARSCFHILKERKPFDVRRCFA